MEIINEFLEEWINDNINFECEKEYVSTIQINLKQDGYVLTILQCFDSVVLYLNKEYLYSCVKRKTLGKEEWLVVTRTNMYA